MTNQSRMRRTPQQARGQRRVSQILDAAAEVFAETGYEAATTNAIAIRANTSIGSLYQFFPNKHAILSALALRYRGQLDQLLDSVFDGDPASLQNTLEILIDRMTEFYQANPAFQAMFVAAQDSRALGDVADEMGRVIAARVHEHLTATIPSLDAERSEFYATIVVLMMRALIPPGVSGDARREPGIIAQLKRMIFAYLRSLEHLQDQPFSFGD